MLDRGLWFDPDDARTGQNQPDAIAVAAGSVYWTNYNNVGAVGSIVKVDVGGGTPVTIADGQSGPGNIAVDPNSVYWSNNYNGSPRWDGERC